MKKLLFCTLVIYSITAYSQPFGEAAPGYRIIRSEYDNSSGEKGTTYFRYDQYDHIVKALWKLDDDSRYSLNDYENDPNGNIVSAYREFSDSLTSFEYLVYDSSGNKTAEYFIRSDGITGYATYTYENGLLKRAVFHKHKGWLTGELELHYTDQNRKEKGVLYRGGIAICNVTYLYDNIGNLTQESWDFNGKWSQTFNNVYSRKELKKHYYSSPYLCGASDFRIAKEDYTFNDESGGPSVYHYNSKGELAKKVYTHTDGLTTNTFYKYDGHGKLISSVRKYSDSTTALFTYGYDENDRLITRNFYRADTLAGFESYLYNADGELIKGYMKNVDGWLSGSIDYTSDLAGRLQSGEFKGQDGITAYIAFLYNKEGLISEIRWEFSFGKFQRYHFDYEPVPLTEYCQE